MKIKHLFRMLFVLAVLAVVSPVSAARATEITPVETRVIQLENRLKEIKAMDIKSMSKNEKKALRGEVGAIKKELNAVGGGVYLSAGALLLVILLLILLL